jgi:hypothetical protein
MSPLVIRLFATAVPVIENPSAMTAITSPLDGRRMELPPLVDAANVIADDEGSACKRFGNARRGGCQPGGVWS